MLLSIKDRLVLNALVPKMLPTVASRALYAQVDSLARELSFTEAEIADAGIAFDESGAASWAKPTDKSVDIAEPLLKLIAAGFRRMDASGEVPRDAIDVFDKFVPPEEWAKEKA